MLPLNCWTRFVFPMQAERKEKAERQREKRRSEIEKERRGACIEYNFHFDVFYDTSVLFLFHFFFLPHKTFIGQTCSDISIYVCIDMYLVGIYDFVYAFSCFIV